LASVIVFDHDANHRFGATGPEDYPAALAKFHGCFLYRAYQLGGTSDQRPFVGGDINVDEYLRMPGHHISDACQRPPDPGHDGQEIQAYEQAVRSRGVISDYDAARLGAAQ
jgi:hypothetical protein